MEGPRGVKWTGWHRGIVEFVGSQKWIIGIEVHWYRVRYTDGVAEDVMDIIPAIGESWEGRNLMAAGGKMILDQLLSVIVPELVINSRGEEVWEWTPARVDNICTTDGLLMVYYHPSSRAAHKFDQTVETNKLFPGEQMLGREPIHAVWAMMYNPQVVEGLKKKNYEVSDCYDLPKNKVHSKNT
ncbi:hypothetical protein EW146_g3163 [Bondarzewia mesenterica]|uniref:Uncharacterized protein n=1 Tax=Bondarzewia mesenterica TaxID=1095465 RepID=A0A4V3XFJ0_9AGAM|nr:hypothetical protein EW146_g3163 [Bondarzewia mesenterica]